MADRGRLTCNNCYNVGEKVNKIVELAQTIWLTIGSMRDITMDLGKL